MNLSTAPCPDTDVLLRQPVVITQTARMKVQSIVCIIGKVGTMIGAKPGLLHHDDAKAGNNTTLWERAKFAAACHTAPLT